MSRPVYWPALPASPYRAAWARLLTAWRRWRCGHFDWTPLDGPCAGCGKDIR